MITDFRDLEDYRKGDVIASVQAKIAFVDEKEGQRGVYYKVCFEDSRREKMYCIVSKGISARDKGSMVTLRDVILDEYQGKPQFKFDRNSKIDLGGSREDRGYDNPPRRTEARSEAPRASGGYSGSVPYKSLEDMGYAWQLCMKQAKSDVQEFADTGENQFMLQAMTVATSYFIEGNRSGLLQRLIVEDANRGVGNTGRPIRQRDPDSRDRDRDAMEDDDIPF